MINKALDLKDEDRLYVTRKKKEEEDLSILKIVWM